MRQNTLLLPTLREAPFEAEAAGHALLLRAGFIRQMAAGVYTYLPLGWRVLRKAAAIIREEMDAAGAQEVLMPAMQPAELWKASGRYGAYGPELIRLRDRHNREFALGPTHEEVVTSLVGNEVSSYRRLPMTLYQIQTKFRDERRPRFGLLRGREFMMKDAYSFAADWESLDETYRNMLSAYRRIFERCGLRFKAVEADPGAIGGEGGSHEFMALAEVGEDTIAVCSHCDYASNLEKAESRPLPGDDFPGAGASMQPLAKIHTPSMRSVGEVAAGLAKRPRDIVKTLICLADGKPVAVLLRGDRELNEVKVKNFLGASELELADADEVLRITGAPAGFAGPAGLDIPLLVDREAAVMTDAVIGANETDYHFLHAAAGRDFPLERTGDFGNAAPGERCPRCEGTLSFHRGIEVGHVFKLGTKYSGELGALFLNAAGEERPMIMGCYGIGVSRLLAAVAEQRHDEGGIVWPKEIAPFQVHIVPVAVKDARQMEIAERLYGKLQAQGLDALLDDRDERPGVKFKDADLIGIPVRIVVGKGAAEGVVEVKRRTDAEPVKVRLEAAVSAVYELLG